MVGWSANGSRSAPFSKSELSADESGWCDRQIACIWITGLLSMIWYISEILGGAFDRYIQMYGAAQQGELMKMRAKMGWILLCDVVVIACQFISCLSVLGEREAILGSTPGTNDFARVCRGYGWDVTAVVSFCLNYINVMLIFVIRLGKSCSLCCPADGSGSAVPVVGVAERGPVVLCSREMRALSGREFARLPFFSYVDGLAGSVRTGDEKEAGPRCSICYEEYVTGDSMTALSCLHKFHRVCVKRWLTTQKNSCPECCVLVLSAEDRKPERQRPRDPDADLAAAIALSIADLAH
jgi:hypothetical protein